MASITLSEKEYNKLKEQASKVPLLEKAANKDGYVIITRYDRDLSIDNPIVDSYVDFIWEEFNRQYGNRGYSNGGFAMQSYGQELATAKKFFLKEAIKSFIVKYLNSTDKKDFSKISSKLVNFEEVEKEIKELYNHKYFEEFGERILKFKNKEAQLQQRIKDFDEINKNKIERLEKRIKDLEEFENKYYKDEKKISDLEFKLSEENSKIDLYRETITTQKEEIERLTSKKR